MALREPLNELPCLGFPSFTLSREKVIVEASVVNPWTLQSWIVCGMSMTRGPFTTQTRRSIKIEVPSKPFLCVLKTHKTKRGVGLLRGDGIYVL